MTEATFKPSSATCVLQLDSGSESHVELAKQAIYWRGLFVNRYAGIEYAIAELVSRAYLHTAYSALGQPPFGSAKKLERLRRVIKLGGPIANYQCEIQPFLEQFACYEGDRHFMTHALMVPRTSADILFKMYDHREGAYSVGTLQFELTQLEQLARLIGPISSDFTGLVAKICREIPLPEA